uniref:Uncharacterized protein n=1 Tax=Nelumbo nucifera TaxID=4432 RepID=A0A822ZRB9_NELNU|nr:TPA_asm: hypothetical protein HUJ06_004291 [Nelumbo nucifera]
MALALREMTQRESPSGYSLQQHVAPVRFFAKQAAPVYIFLEVMKKFDTVLGVLRKEKIRIGPNDPAEKADLYSESQRIQYTIQTCTQAIQDANISIEGDTNQERPHPCLGAEAMKPLLRSDEKGMALLMSKFDKINKKLGIWREDLSKYDKRLELKIAKKREEFKDETMVDIK